MGLLYRTSDEVSGVQTGNKRGERCHRRPLSATHEGVDVGEEEEDEEDGAGEVEVAEVEKVLVRQFHLILNTRSRKRRRRQTSGSHFIAGPPRPTAGQELTFMHRPRLQEDIGS